MILNYWKYHKFPILFAIAAIFLYGSFAYDLLRTDFTKLITLYGALFFLFYKLVQFEKGNFKLLLVLAILFRLVFLFTIPNLSQDFYRFIWDGRMILEGWTPYLYTPESLIASGTAPIDQAKELYEGMGWLSAGNHTNYPPLHQLGFIIAGIFAGKSIVGSVVVMRIVIIAAELGTLYFGKKLLERLNLPVHYIFFYTLNPFIIIELTGNLHFEAVMIFFLVWGLYLLHIEKWRYAALVMALSVSVKLIPLLFLPLVFQKLGWKKSIIFYTIIGIVNFLLFLPFLSPQFIQNYTETTALWFTNFEFNGSFYYLIRELGYHIKGYNIIRVFGKITPYILLAFVLAMAFLRKSKSTSQLITAMLFSLFFYYAIATVVHPWYIATLVILSLFTKYRFPLVWSFVIILSYIAYGNADYKENYPLLFIAYGMVYGYFLYEVIKYRPNSAQPF
ncbi:mannosyltransferase [Leptobacterium sp. I13]|uniref:mannosyltransferase n=1 Tax=Leptobacterium meishanense TaxID=3128904 RepID=UPI0030EC6CE0